MTIHDPTDDEYRKRALAASKTPRGPAYRARRDLRIGVSRFARMHTKTKAHILYSNITALARSDDVDRKLIDRLHELRVEGNRACHPYERWTDAEAKAYVTKVQKILKDDL